MRYTITYNARKVKSIRIELMNNKLLKLRPDRESETAMYINRAAVFEGEILNVKYVLIKNGSEFIELMHFTRMLLNEDFRSSIDRVCYDAKGDIQYVYDILFYYIRKHLDFEFVDGFYLDAVSHFNNINDINDESSPILSGIMLFCEENWVFHKVEDFAED